MNFKIALLTSTLILFTACGGGGSKGDSKKEPQITCQATTTSAIFYEKTTTSFTINNPIDEPIFLVTSIQKSLEVPTEFNKKELYNLFQTEYYWAESTKKDFDYTPYSSPQLLINDLRNPKDRWSFAMTKEDYSNVTSQKSGGFGFSCQEVNNGCHVTYVRIDSPADRAGLKRGDVITQINDNNATYKLIYNTGQELEKVAKLSLIRKNSNEICTGNITPKEYTYKVALGKSIQTSKGETVGYFRLDSFMGAENIVKQIDKAFNNFKKEKIKKLVIDLRYNGGGSVSVASKLLDKLTTTQEKKEQFTLAWNDDYSKNNESYFFEKDNNSLNLEQIIFLTTQRSASASELVISAMKPYLSSENLIIIGDKTHGKPVGMGAKTDNNYYYFLINFVVQNSDDFYDYFNGLPVTDGCKIEDDPFHEMGDPKESMLKAALNYVDNGECT